jgi:hypothetical protein
MIRYKFKFREFVGPINLLFKYYLSSILKQIITPPPRPEPYSFPENKINIRIISKVEWKISSVVEDMNMYLTTVKYKHGDNLDFYIRKLKKIITPPPRPEPYSFPENKIKFLFIWDSIKYVDQLELNMSFEMIK